MQRKNTLKRVNRNSRFFDKWFRAHEIRVKSAFFLRAHLPQWRRIKKQNLFDTRVSRSWTFSLRVPVSNLWFTFGIERAREFDFSIFDPRCYFSPIESFVSEKITITFQFEWWRPTNVTVIFLTWIEISSCDKYFITTKEWPRLLEAVIRTKIKLILSFVDREEFVFFSFFFVESSRYGQEILSFSDINNSDCDSFSMGLLLIAFFIISSNFIQFVMPGKFYGFWNKTKIKRERETLFSSKSSLKIF